jgi:hypothetical protein
VKAENAEERRDRRTRSGKTSTHAEEGKRREAQEEV